MDSEDDSMEMENEYGEEDYGDFDDEEEFDSNEEDEVIDYEDMKSALESFQKVSL
jgi:hypothetical protein